MTVSELKNEFLIHYNAIATNSAPGLDDYEISVFLTKAQLEIVKNYYNPNGNKYKDGFENSEKRRTDLKELVKDYKSTTIIPSTTAISTDSKFFKIPNDVFAILHEYGKVSSSDCLNGELLSVYPKTHDEYSIQIDNPFKNPDRATIWRLNTSMIGSDKVVELISPYTLSMYQFRYIKFPRPIVISDLSVTFPGEGLSIDGVTAQQTSELDQEVHREIVDRAVELALRDYKPSNLESKIQLDSRNE